MAAQQIQCFTTEKQMDDALKLVQAELNKTDIKDISDIDEAMIYSNNGHRTEFRVCVEFDIYADSIWLKQAEILNSDWDVLIEDTAVFQSRIKTLIGITNEANNELFVQSIEIRKDQLQSILS